MSLLETRGLSLSFGGVQALHELEYTVHPGRVHAVIGPNGAGKTTLFNIVTGVYVPTSGSVHLEARDVTGFPVHELAALGISRSFQNLELFLNMTVLENVMVGRHLHSRRGFVQSLLHTPAVVQSDRRARHRALQLLEWVGLEGRAGEKADALPYGDLKRLDIARALACGPKLLLLDEPAAGLNTRETQEIGGLIERISETGITVVLVEHDMRLVMGVSDHVLVLNHGEKLAEGTAAEVRDNPDVIAAYLGGGPEDDHAA